MTKGPKLVGNKHSPNLRCLSCIKQGNILVVAYFFVLNMQRCYRAWIADWQWWALYGYAYYHYSREIKDIVTGVCV